MAWNIALALLQLVTSLSLFSMLHSQINRREWKDPADNLIYHCIVLTLESSGWDIFLITSLPFFR